jgi:hypothetical protein
MRRSQYIYIEGWVGMVPCPQVGKQIQALVGHCTQKSPGPNEMAFARTGGVIYLEKDPMTSTWITIMANIRTRTGPPRTLNGFSEAILDQFLCDIVGVGC